MSSHVHVTTNLWIFTEKKINGFAFKLINEEDFKSIKVSEIGVVIIGHLKKTVSFD